MAPIFETARLTLREMSLADLDFMATMLAHPEVMRYYPKCLSREEAQAWVQRNLDRYAKYGHGGWLVLDKSTGEPVGQVGVHHVNVEGADEKEVGYLIHRPFWRRHYATEAALACRDYVFDQLGRHRVISLIRPENVPSQGVAHKLGMTPEKRIVQHGGFPHLVFSMTRADHTV